MAMDSQRIKMEIIIYGGRPWGFSIKGGRENNKPLVISKLEKEGKAESGGLLVGDVVHSINNTFLSGVRDEAIRLVKSSGLTLTLAIERGMSSKRARSGGMVHPSSLQSTPSHSRDCCNASLASEQDPLYFDEFTQTTPQAYSNEHLDAKNDDVFPSGYTRYSFDDRHASTLSLNENFSAPLDVAAHRGDVSSLISKSNPDGQTKRAVNTNLVGDAVPHPVVKLRTRKARDKSIPVERPRSWHASKHPELDPGFSATERNMRSPGSGYLGNSTSQSRPYYQQPLSQPRRRSKGWSESGDLKSVYKGDMDGSKDSLISGSSQRSYRSSGRLSVSSSKSSGTMSSSRGSLENLIENSYNSRSDNYPQFICENGRYKQKSPLKPQSGIVNHKRNIFERLSHESSSITDNQRQSRGSREELEKPSYVRRYPSADKEEKNSNHQRESSKSPLQYSGPNRRRASFSPPPTNVPVEREGGYLRKRSFDRDSWHSDHSSTNRPESQHTVEPRKSKPDTSYHTSSSNIRYSNAKIVKTNFDSRRNPHNVPEPPQRDNSSIQAVKNYHSRPYSGGHSQDDYPSHHISPSDHSSHSGRLSPSKHTSHSTVHTVAPVSYDEMSETSGIMRPIEKSSDASKSFSRQERMFGVMSAGTGKNVLATDITISPNKEDGSETQSQNFETKSSNPSKYEHLKDAYTGVQPYIPSSDYVSRKANKIEDRSTTQSSNSQSASDHRKSGSGESNESSYSKGKGKYGSVWKTPQNLSQNLSNAAPNLVTGSSDTPTLNESVSNTQTKQDDQDPADNRGIDVQVDNLPSILRSLQNTQHGDRRYKNLEPKSASDDYEKIWYSESSPRLDETKTTASSGKLSTQSTSPQENNPPHYKNWKSEFKEVNLDEPMDGDAFSPQDRYCNDIKDMSRKVLRATSFTRRDLEVSPSLQIFEQKQNRFNFPSPLAQKPQQAVKHSRSRSHDNEADNDESEALTSRSNSNDSLLSEPSKPRPKSAGVVRSDSNRHAPALRATVAPPRRPASYYARNCESLPRNMLPSYGSDESASPISPTNQGPYPNKRTLIEVKPETDILPGGQQEATKVDTRAAVLNFISRKTGKSFESGDLGRYTSSTSLHTTHSDETDKRRSKENSTSPDENRLALHGSSGDLPNAVPESEFPAKVIKATPVTHKPEHGRSVRKLKSIRETKDKLIHGFHRLRSRTKSASSLLVGENTSDKRASTGSSLASMDISASLENFNDSGLDLSQASPVDNLDSAALIGKRRSKSTQNIEPSPGNHDHPSNESLVETPSRKYVRHHRQRHSNSSSMSSATTVSTLSSFSSSSSTSVGRFPALGEESEKLITSVFPEHRPPSAQQSASPSSTEAEVAGNAENTARTSRVAIDTGTYRVAKRKGARDSTNAKSSVSHTHETSYKSTKEIMVKAPKPETDQPSVVSNPLQNLPPPLPKPISVPTPILPEENEKVKKIMEKVKRSSSFRDVKQKDLPLPPPPPPLDDASEQVLNEMVQQHLEQDLPPPPSVLLKEPLPANSSSVPLDISESALDKSVASVPSAISEQRRNGTFVENCQRGKGDLKLPQTMNNINSTSPSSYENTHENGVSHSYENVFKPIEQPSSGPHRPTPVELPTHPENPKKNTEKSESCDANLKETYVPSSIPPLPPPEVSSEPLLPDVPLLTEPSSLQEEHPDLTRDIIKGDKTLAQVLTTSNKKALDYMAGVLAQPSHYIVEAGIRYRRKKPTNPSITAATSDHEQANNNPLTQNGLSSHDNLPASSTYYKTSASKGKILNLVKEKIAEGEIPLENQETFEDINKKKIELVLSIKEKLNDLESMKGLLDVEMRENEGLGKHVHDLTKKVCTQREQDKYNIFVQDVDKIINLLLSLSGRLARVENAIQMLPADAAKQEMELLCDKRKKLTEQHNEAKQLKENIDRRQKAVSEILAGYFDQEQFADYEHYIKMKSALIMEQRELDDKTKLGHEQMQCLRDSLPEDWQRNLDNMIEE